MAYRIFDLELSAPPGALTLGPEHDGFALLGRWQGRPVGFSMLPAAPGATLEGAALRRRLDRDFATAVLATRAEAEFALRWPPAEAADPPPALSVAICTRDRAERLGRLLGTLDAVRATSRFRALEVLVVDNASATDQTRRAVERLPWVRYVAEPRAGLDFARNAAVRAATGELLAFLDDDVVVDRFWLEGLFEAWRDCPDAGGFTGLVLPLRLDTAAQIAFEERGGFGRGCSRIHHRAASFANPLHPVGAGVVGAGCNMAFDRALLHRLGGFDEALDTGPPLPGGGDLDVFYRVLRAGRTMVYEPRYAVFHEHRETQRELRRQYWSWGLGFMAFLSKSRHTDRPLRRSHAAMVRWWFVHQVGRLAKATLRLRADRIRCVAAELRGGVQGLLGEYGRSVRRSRRIREQTP